MTRKYYLTEGRVLVGELTDRRMTWWRHPRVLAPILHALGPAVGVVDDQGATYTGDLFWDWSGGLTWDMSAFKVRAVPS